MVCEELKLEDMKRIVKDIKRQPSVDDYESLMIILEEPGVQLLKVREISTGNIYALKVLNKDFIKKVLLTPRVFIRIKKEIKYL